MYPVLFSLGETPIHAYGFLIAVALILGWILSLRLARNDQLPADQLGTAYVVAVAGGLLAARLMWLFQHPEHSGDLTAIIQLQAGQLSGFGGVLAGLIIAGVYCQNKKIPPWAWLDCAAPAFLLGMVLERVGAFLAGADFGHYVDPDFFMAIQFPTDTPVYDIQRRDLAGMRLPAEQTLPVHPSQLYAAAVAAVGAGLTFVIRARRQYSGQVALFALGAFAVARYLVEDPFRYDRTPDVAGPISLGQVTALVVVAVVVSVHFARLKKVQEDPSLRQWTGGPWTPGAEDEAETKKASKKKASKKKASKKKAGAKKSGTKKAGTKKSAAKKTVDTTAEAKPKGDAAD